METGWPAFVISHSIKWEGDSIMNVDDLDMLDAVIKAYYQRNSTGGSLHVFLDDGNCDRETLLFCRDRARERDDPIGEAIATMLLRAPDDVIEECRFGWSFGYASWLKVLLP